jgi:hypothetical protein
MPDIKKLSLKCKRCSKETVFDQPYPYHAGFADQGFLYNDAGTLTLVWSTLDPVLEIYFPGQAAWVLNPLNRRRFEKMLPPSPVGGRWRFRNPARCIHCGKQISKPMLRSVHYLIFPGSIITIQDNQLKLGEYINSAA